MTTRTVSVELQAKVGQYTSSMDKASRVTAQTESAVERTSKSTEGMSKRFAIAGGVAAGALVIGLKQALNAASDLNETTSKVGVIFGDAADEITAWADTADTALGQSKQQAMDAASTFATFGKSAGLAGNDLSDFSIEMSTLASDLASFYNSSPQEAIDAIGAALRGETEPIRRYGVMLDDASMRQEALRLGLINTTKDALTPQQKVLAAQSLILKQTSDAQGDFARTSDGVANKQRILAAQLENTKAELGQNLLPALQKVLGVTSDVVKVFNDLPGPVQNTVLGLALVGGAALIAAPKIMATVTALKEAKSAMSGMSSSSAVAAGSFALIAAALGLVASGFAEAASARDQMNKFAPSGMKEYQANIERTRAKVADLEDGITSAGDAIDWFRHAASYGTLDDAWRTGVKYVQGYNSALNDIQYTTGASLPLIQKTAETVWDENKSYLENKAAVEAAVKAKSKGTDAGIKLAEAELKAGDAASTAADKTQAYKDALDALNSPSLDVRESQRQLEAAYDDATQAQKENGRTLNINTEKGRANAESLDKIAEAAIRAADAQREKDGNDKRANETLRTARARLEKQAEAFGMSKAAAKKYADQVLKIPGEKRTKVVFDDKQARTKVDRFIRDYNGKKVVVTVTTTTNPDGTRTQTKVPAGVTGARATGGPLVAGERYNINERGQEWLQLSRDGLSGYIRPGKPVDAGGRGARSITVSPGAVSVELSGTTLTRQDAEQIADRAIGKLVRELETL